MSRKLPKQLVFILFFLLTGPTFLTCSLAGKQIKTTQKTIILDPGHGGKDSGLISSGNISEKEITLLIAKKISELLKDKYNILLTRTNDQNLKTEQRTGLANQAGADLYLSIHLNQSVNDLVYGYYYSHPDSNWVAPEKNDKGWKSQSIIKKEKSKKMADIFSNVFKSGNAPLKKCHIIEAPVKPLEGSAMPAFMVEILSIVNIPASKEARNKKIEKSAVILAECINKYLN